MIYLSLLFAFIFLVYEPVMMPYMGLLIVGASLARTSSLFIFIFNFFNAFIFVAFDYYISNRGEGLLTGLGDGFLLNLICFVNIILVLVINRLFESKSSIFFQKYVNTSVAFPRIGSIFFYPSLSALILCIAYALYSGEMVIGANFDVDEIERNPLFEYISLVFLAGFFSCQASKVRRKLIFAINGILCLVLLASSFRMAFLINVLSLIVVVLNMRSLNKLSLLAFFFVGYIVLVVVGLMRIGISAFDISMLAGYVNGRLDNTFTGVIETSLIYANFMFNLSWLDMLKQLASVVVPVPVGLMPDGFSYSKYIYDVFEGKVPGGGLLAGYVVYFRLALIPVIVFYLYFASKFNENVYVHKNLAYIVMFVTLPRWWLYNPAVLFKFFVILYIFVWLGRILYASRVRV